jgi:uncharacterized iron-regulated membrane protein
MHFNGRWVPPAVMEYFTAFAIILGILVGILALWSWRGRRAAKTRKRLSVRPSRDKKQQRRKR